MLDQTVTQLRLPPAIGDALKRSNVEEATLAALVKAIEQRSIARYRRAVGYKWALVELKNDLTMWLFLGEIVSEWIMRGSYEADVTSFIMSALKPGGTFIDMGANVGWYTLNAAKYYKANGGKVVSFEPQPEVYRRLKASIGVGGFDEIVSLHNVALSNEAGSMRMIGMASNLGWAQLVPDQVKDSPVNTASGEFSVDVCRLDAMGLEFERIDVLKIDVEGAELLCFQGAIDFLKKHRPLIVSEIHNKKLVEISKTTASEYVSFMMGLGYSCHVFVRGGLVPYDPDTVASQNFYNAVFRPET